MARQLIILGTGGFAREVYQLFLDTRKGDAVSGTYEFLGFVGDEPEKPLPANWLGTDDVVLVQNPENIWFVVAIGNPAVRRTVYEKYEQAGFQPGRLIHPAATLGEDFVVPPGAMICAGVRITVNVHAGKSLVVNLNATIGHDCEIGDFVTISPGANISGNVSLGNESEIGSGAVLLPGVKTGEKVVLGAGAVLTRNADSGTWMGVPAQQYHTS